MALLLIMSLIVGVGDFGIGRILTQALAAKQAAEQTLTDAVAAKQDAENMLAQIDVYTFTPGSIAELRTKNGVTGTNIQLLGYYAPGDGGGDTFYWDASSTEADNGGTIIKGPAATGRHKRIPSSVTDIRKFGAKADGTDAADAIIKALAFADVVIIPAGTFAFSKIIKLKSNQTLRGEGYASILKASSASVWVECSGNISNVMVRDFKITGDGKNDTRGVYIHSCSNVTVTDVWADQMGSQSTYANPLEDAAGGFGFLVGSSTATGKTQNIQISNCKASNIGGGGNFKGDGYSVSGHSANEAFRPENVKIISSQAQNCGRHLFSVAGHTGQSIPRNVTFQNISGSNAGLCGFDFEVGVNVVLDTFEFTNCGNWAGYYAPSYYGRYNLRAGVATSRGGGSFTVKTGTLTSCYFGISRADEFSTYTDMIIENSEIQDFISLSSSMGKNMVATNCRFLTEKDNLVLYDDQVSDFKFDKCYFAGPAVMSKANGGLFSLCTFARGVRLVNDANKNVTLSRCDFLDFAGDAITLTFTGTTLTVIDGLTIENCNFKGMGKLVYGLRIEYRYGKNVIARNNKFSGLLEAGLYHQNADNWPGFKSIESNEFNGMKNGIIVAQPSQNLQIKNNDFFNISQWAIDVREADSGLNLLNANITGNQSHDGVANGLRLNFPVGSWNKTIVTGNNFDSCTGTKAAIPASGNASGFVNSNVF